MSPQRKRAIYMVNSSEDEGTEIPLLDGATTAYKEDWLQEFIARQPGVLQLHELDENLRDCILLGREIDNIDVLLVSPSGKLVLVETKLWRNPEAHRDVVAQLLDYAHRLRSYDYSELEERVLATAKKTGPGAASLYKLVKSRGRLRDKEPDFRENVTRHLERAEFVLLIVGDQVRPRALELSRYVHKNPDMAYTVAAIELQTYPKEPDAPWPMIVVPTLLVRTLEETRAVVRILYEEKRPETEVKTVEAEPGRRTNQTEFLEKCTREHAEVFEESFAYWKEQGHTIYWGQTGFSLHVLVGTQVVKGFMDGYPPSPGNISILQPKYRDKWALPHEAYQSYRNQLAAVDAFARVMAQDRRYAHLKDINAEELKLLIAETNRLLERTQEAAAEEG